LKTLYRSLEKKTYENEVQVKKQRRGTNRETVLSFSEPTNQNFAGAVSEIGDTNGGEGWKRYKDNESMKQCHIDINVNYFLVPIYILIYFSSLMLCLDAKKIRKREIVMGCSRFGLN
jgi:hypothetical protein